MRTIGIDLAINGTHKAVVADEQGTLITRVIRLRTDPADLDRLLRRARQRAEPGVSLRVLMEPTGLRARTGRLVPNGNRCPAT